MLKTPDHVAQSVTVSWSCSLTFLLDGVATSAVQAQTTEDFADECLTLSGEAASGSQMMTQEVMVPIGWSTVPHANPVVQTAEKLWRCSRCRSLSVWWRFFRSSARKVIRRRDSATGSRGDPAGGGERSI